MWARQQRCWQRWLAKTSKRHESQLLSSALQKEDESLAGTATEIEAAEDLDEKTRH